MWVACLGSPRLLAEKWKCLWSWNPCQDDLSCDIWLVCIRSFFFFFLLYMTWILFSQDFTLTTENSYLIFSCLNFFCFCPCFNCLVLENCLIQTEERNFSTSIRECLFLSGFFLHLTRSWLPSGGSETEGLIPIGGHRVVCPETVMASRSHKGAAVVYLSDPESSIQLSHEGG